jgi:hypothetical protein
MGKQVVASAAVGVLRFESRAVIRRYSKDHRLPSLLGSVLLVGVVIRLTRGVTIALPSANISGEVSTTAVVVESLLVAVLSLATLDSQTADFERAPTARGLIVRRLHCALVPVLLVALTTLPWLDQMLSPSLRATQLHSLTWLGLSVLSAIVLGTRRSWVLPVLALILGSWIGVSAAGVPARWNLIFTAHLSSREAMGILAFDVLALAVLSGRDRRKGLIECGVTP